MDAAEADVDAKLYKASADLIAEVKIKLPLLIWHGGKLRTRPRTHVIASKCGELEFAVRLLCRYFDTQLTFSLARSLSRMAATS